ncbi:MAG: response regulator transcription factor [Pseudomonadota bacterium]
MNKVDADGVVYIVDDDHAVRDSLSFLMKSVGLRSSAHSSADEFMKAFDPEQPGCIVLDIRMPGISGLDLQEALNAQKSITPIIFITGHGDVPMAVEAMQGGAVDFLQKPFRDQELLDRIQSAMQADQTLRRELEGKNALLKRFETLTPREKEILNHVVAGKANKVIAFDLGVSQRTVEIHRARVMEKMAARSLAHLVRMHIAMDIPTEQGPQT